MRTTTDEHRERVYEGVAEYLTKNIHTLPEQIQLNRDAQSHIVSIGTSIMLCKWQLENSQMHGSFVRAILENNLLSAITYSDTVNRYALPFYVTMMHNLGYIQ